MAAVTMTLGCAAASARADSILDYIHLEAGLGGAAYQRGGDGLWLQDGFKHTVQLTAPAIEVGVTGDIYQAARWGVSWHLDYAWLGTIHTNGSATPSDANYNKATKACNGACWPLADYIGSGHDAGFLATIEPHYDVGPWRFGVEFGPYLHNYAWTEDVYGWCSTPTAKPITLHVQHSPSWMLGAVVGASIGYKHFSLVYQYFANKPRSSEPVPPVWQGTHVLLARYRF